MQGLPWVAHGEATSLNGPLPELSIVSNFGPFVALDTPVSMHTRVLTLPHHVISNRINISLTSPPLTDTATVRLVQSGGLVSEQNSRRISVHHVATVRPGLNALDLEVQMGDESTRISYLRLLFEGGNEIRSHQLYGRLTFFLNYYKSAREMLKGLKIEPQSLLLRLGTRDCSLAPSFNSMVFEYDVLLTSVASDCFLIPLAG